jgi:hypothetical protein
MGNMDKPDNVFLLGMLLLRYVYRAMLTFFQVTFPTTGYSPRNVSLPCAFTEVPVRLLSP